MDKHTSSFHRRKLYAAVALANLPMPDRISFNLNTWSKKPYARLVFDAIGDAVAWAHTMKVETQVHRNDEGQDVLCAEGRFAGWPVFLLACQRAEATEQALPLATTQRLRQLTTEVA